ncbi:MAG: hypothetical protein ABSG45_01060 [Nitrososphaerales archaeon]|jgi:hypothetical protein
MGVIADTFGGRVVWSFVSQFEVVEGLLIVALLLLFAIVLEACGFGFVFDSPALSKHLKSPVSHLFTLLAALGVVSFALLVLCNMKQLNNVLDVNGWNLVQYPLNLLGFFGGSALGQNGRVGYGALALLIWGLTIAALSLAKGFAKAVRFFALPSILFLTVVVLLFDPGEMDSQAVNVVSGFTFNGISLLSNWSLLTISLFFTAFELVYRRLWKKDGIRLLHSQHQSAGMGRPQ